MNANAKLWVEALRSGEFKQCQFHLTTPEGDCCLGVACKLAIRAGINLKVEVGEEFNSYDGASQILPERVREWLGLTGRDSGYLGTQLSGENDRGKTFLEIADIIESEPEGLFLPETKG